MQSAQFIKIKKNNVVYEFILFSICIIFNSCQMENPDYSTTNSSETQPSGVDRAGNPVLTYPIGAINVEFPLFKWEAVNSATHYWLIVADNQDIGSGNWLINQNGIRVNQYQAPSSVTFEIGKMYYWKVKYISGSTPGTWSEIKSFIIIPGPVLLSPLNDMYEAAPVFRWNSVPNVTSYWLLVMDGPGAEYQWIIDVRNVPGNTGSSVIAYSTPPGIHFTIGKTYYWKVKSIAGSTPGYWSALKPFTPFGSTSPYRSLAEYYAPVIYQDIDTEGNCRHADGGRSDYITNFNFDGNWNALDNWENEPDYPLKGYVYYSVVESTRRYYITYAFFHPRDYKNQNDIFDTEHENDMEGIWMSVYKDGTAYGMLEALITAAHFDFYQYSNYNIGEREDIDGGIIMDYNHPRIYVQARGHGIKGHESWGTDFPGGDGVVYKYTGTAQEPKSVTSHLSWQTACTYDLVHIDELWKRRYKGTQNYNETFYSFYQFRGDSSASCGCGLSGNSPNPPWGWDDDSNIANGYSGDGDMYRGEHFFNPAHYFDYTLALEKISGHTMPSVPNETYVYNPYCLTLDLDQYMITWDKDGGGDLSDGYFNLFMKVSNDEWIEVLDGDSGKQKSWIGWDLAMNTWHDLNVLMNGWNHFYGIQTSSTSDFFIIRSRDWDSGSGDEWLMSHEGDHYYPGTSYEDGYHFLNMAPGTKRQEIVNWNGSLAKITLTVPAEPSYTR